MRPLPDCVRCRRRITPLRYKTSVAEKRADTILELMQFIERATLNRALTGLTDDELHWEPHRGAWGVRPRSDCTTATPIGDGDWVMDFESRSSSSPIAAALPNPWRRSPGSSRTSGRYPGCWQREIFSAAIYGGGSGAPFMYQAVIFHDADHAVSTLRDGWRALETALRDATDEALERPSVEHYGPSNGMQLTVGALNEVSHRGTQMCMLRDLFAHR